MSGIDAHTATQEPTTREVTEEPGRPRRQCEAAREADGNAEVPFALALRTGTFVSGLPVHQLHHRRTAGRLA